MATDPTMGKSSPDFYITRTIHPVGQGAFYSESFYGEGQKCPCLTAVYDCGGNKTCCKTEIKALKRLDILFISHFHDDHINCVTELLKLNSNAYVFIPGVTHSRFIIDLVANYFRSGTVSPSISFMMRCVPALKKSKALPIHFSIQINQDFGSKSCGLTSGSFCAISPSAHASILIQKEKCLWCYDTYYNGYNTSKEEKLIEKLSEEITSLKEILGKIDEYRDSEWYQEHLLVELSELTKSKEKIERIKKCYTDVFGKNHNSYSMIVHSHPETEGKRKIDCLFTGDSEPRSLINVVEQTKPRYIQVPHHGSSKNHDLKYYSHHPTVFISVGEDNQYNHPRVKTIADILRKCQDVYVITEKKDTKYKRRFKI